MKSKGDPILDAQAVCQEKPRGREDLIRELKALGWHGTPAKESTEFALLGGFLEEREGLLHAAPKPDAVKMVQAILKQRV